MRAVVTGQVGLDKKSYLQSVARIAGERGDRVELFNVGDLMYGEAPDVRPGRILDLPLSRLASLRRAAFKDIIGSTSPAEDHPNVIVNTHATFRWRHGLFAAFDFDLLRRLKPDMFICMVDNIEVVHHRLHAEHDIAVHLDKAAVGIIGKAFVARRLGEPGNRVGIEAEIEHRVHHAGHGGARA